MHNHTGHIHFCTCTVVFLLLRLHLSFLKLCCFLHSIILYILYLARLCMFLLFFPILSPLFSILCTANEEFHYIKKIVTLLCIWQEMFWIWILIMMKEKVADKVTIASFTDLIGNNYKTNTWKCLCKPHKITPATPSNLMFKTKRSQTRIFSPRGKKSAARKWHNKNVFQKGDQPDESRAAFNTGAEREANGETAGVIRGWAAEHWDTAWADVRVVRDLLIWSHTSLSAFRRRGKKNKKNNKVSDDIEFLHERTHSKYLNSAIFIMRQTAGGLREGRHCFLLLRLLCIKTTEWDHRERMTFTVMVAAEGLQSIKKKTKGIY